MFQISSLRNKEGQERSCIQIMGASDAGRLDLRNSHPSASINACLTSLVVSPSEHCHGDNARGSWAKDRFISAPSLRRLWQALGEKHGNHVYKIR
jgi:hypothetical protein